MQLLSLLHKYQSTARKLHQQSGCLHHVPKWKISTHFCKTPKCVPLRESTFELARQSWRCCGCQTKQFCSIFVIEKWHK
jgi:hypothetical protein